MSTLLYEQFFLHYFVSSQEHRFAYLNQKFKPYNYPTLDHPKRACQLGYLKNYKCISSKYLQYVPQQKTQIKLTVSMIMEIIQQVYAEYDIFFMKGGAYRIVFNQKEKGDMSKLKAHIQEMTLLKLTDKFIQYKHQYKTLDKYLLGFFFTLNYIKTCNLDVKGFCMLLYQDSLQESRNIENVFGNFMIRRLSCRLSEEGFNQAQHQDESNNDSCFKQQYTTNNVRMITISSFQRLLKIISKDQQLVNVSLLTHQYHSSSSHRIYNTSPSPLQQFSTIKSSLLPHQQFQQRPQKQQKLRSVIGLQIYMKFLKQNNAKNTHKMTQIKIYKLMKLIGVTNNKKNIQDAIMGYNKYSDLKGWADVLGFCVGEMDRKVVDIYQRRLNGGKYKGWEDNGGELQDGQNGKVPYEKILLIEICRKNFAISQRFSQILEPNTNHSPSNESSISLSAHLLQNYLQQSFEFIFSYMQELFQSSQKICLLPQQDQREYPLQELFIKLQKLYNFGNAAIIKPIVIKVLKHPQMHKIYLKYLQENQKSDKNNSIQSSYD